MLQYLVGVEGIAPDIITATSAGAIAATVLAQARTLARVRGPGRTRSRATCWPGPRPSTSSASRPGSARSTARRSGREIHQEITEGTRPPFPLDAVHRAGGQRGGAGLRLRPQGPAPGPPGPAHAASATWPRLVAGAGLRLPRVRRQPAQQRQLGPQPRAAGRRPAPRQRGRGPGRRPRPDRPPGPAAAPGRHRAARRRPALRDRGRHHRGVRRPHARAGACRRPGRPRRRRHRLGERAHGLPAAPDGRRRLRRRRGDRDRPGLGRGRPRGDPHHRRRGRAARGCPATSGTTPPRRPATSACAPWG